ncbi:hypothetical protein [Moraxella lacunata]|uniref:hypothetical protein n=1 Tax=Moraxella lacunata TaxID=477 RepID=UPI003EE32199
MAITWRRLMLTTTIIPKTTTLITPIVQTLPPLMLRLMTGVMWWVSPRVWRHQMSLSEFLWDSGRQRTPPRVLPVVLSIFMPIPPRSWLVPKGKNWLVKIMSCALTALPCCIRVSHARPSTLPST